LSPGINPVFVSPWACRGSVLCVFIQGLFTRYVSAIPFGWLAGVCLSIFSGGLIDMFQTCCLDVFGAVCLGWWWLLCLLITRSTTLPRCLC